MEENFSKFGTTEESFEKVEDCQSKVRDEFDIWEWIAKGIESFGLLD